MKKPVIRPKSAGPESPPDYVQINIYAPRAIKEKFDAMAEATGYSRWELLEQLMGAVEVAGS